ncbi:MAG: hypothetical protein J6P72_05940 [Firmicutes bacterium]|nr:hypothetical protein [Bacillota bacterium]
MRNSKNTFSIGWIIAGVIAILILRRVLRANPAASTGASIFSILLITALVIILVVIAATVLIILLVHKDDKKVVKAKAALAEGKTEQLSMVLGSYKGRYGIGSIAEIASRQVSNIEKKGPSLIGLIKEKFEEGSMSYDRFQVPVSNGIDTVRENSLKLATMLEGFDDQDFQKLARAMETGEYRHDLIDDEIQKERYLIYQNSLSEMERIVSTNERMLLMLDRISVELSKLQSNQIDQDGSKILEEIEELTKTAKYYQSKL